MSIDLVHERVSIVIPTKNEAANLAEVLPRLPEVHEVILVDAGSTDGTVDVARRILPDVKVVRQTRKGKGNAMACGFQAATGRILVMFDADGSADPAEIERFVRALLDGADFAKGSRHLREGGSSDLTLLRAAGNKGLNLVANLMFWSRFSDLCYGYNAFWRDLVPVLDLPSVDQPAAGKDMLWGDGFEIETVINVRLAAAKANIVEVPSFELDRIHGESNLNTFADGARVLRTIFSEFGRSLRRDIPRVATDRHYAASRADLIVGEVATEKAA